MHFNRLTILVPLFIVLASAATFAVHFNWLSYSGQGGLSFNIMQVHAEDGGDGGSGGGDGGDSGGSDSGGGAGDSGSDSGGGAGDDGSDSGGGAGDMSGDVGSGGDSADTGSTPDTPTPPTFELSINKTELTPGEGVTVHPGDTITYKIQHATGGSGDQTDVWVADQIPPHTHLVSQTSTELPFQGNAPGTTLDWFYWQQVSALPGGSAGSIQVVVSVDSDIPDGGQICNHAYVSSIQAGPVNSAYVCNPVSNPPPQVKGCIKILKETFDASGNKLTPVTAFTFTLDGDKTVTTDANGDARFDGVVPGAHDVTEAIKSGWDQLSVTPASGHVTVPAGASCAAVVFKNKQTGTPPPPGPGCITIHKKTFDPNGVKLSTVAQFTFKLDDGRTVMNDADGNARFDNVSLGAHTVTEESAGSFWNLFSTNPPDGKVTVVSGSYCADVEFKNKQVVSTPPAPVCTLSASPTSVTSGGTTTLSWTTTNAATFSLDHSIGLVNTVASGTTTSAALTTDTSFTGTATSASGQTVTCTANVIVTHPGGGSGPVCSLVASPANITQGSSATLTWGGTNLSSVTIDNGVGATTTIPSSTSVSPTGVGDHLYTGTFTAANGSTLICTATVTITGGGGGGGCTSNCGGGGGGGGGNPHPNVSLFSHPSTQPLAYLYLSQIPYTGLDLGTFGTVLYWVALVGWALALAYLVLFGAVPLASRRMSAFGERVSNALNTPQLAMASTNATLVMPAARPSAAPRAAAEHPQAQQYSPYEGFKSFAREDALSIDDIVKGLSKMPADFRPFASTEPAVAPKTEPIYDHVEPIYDHVEPIREEYFAPAPSAHAAPAAPAAVPAQVPAFLEALLRGDRETVFGMLREVVRNGGDAEAFFTQVACALDDAYRARLEGIPVHPEIARITASVATPVLERVVTAFASAVDSSYSVGITGAKLALTRALATLGA